MKKFITHQEYENLGRINTLPFRSHYIPFLIKEKFKFKHHIIDKEKSSEVILLNGNWDFKAYKTYEVCKYIDEKLDDKIVVPGCVQSQGYDYFQYINYTYPFFFNPPFIKDNNPLFHYRKKITINNIKNPFIVFEGVDSCFYLYINNAYVGYSQISHSKSEFDLKKYLKEGENIIDVFVLKWCASSYLEDQDKFRFSGIFRDVYILNRPNDYIWDYKIRPIYKDNKWYISIDNLSNTTLTITFKNTKYSVNKDENINILVNNPILWSDNNPYLYSLIIGSSSEKILEKVGLVRVEIKDSIFYINGSHKKLKGINRHESNPNTGSYVSVLDTLKDLKLIKSINANAIRTSHYPNIPEFYELCNLLGIYVLDEADVETHGAVLENYSLQSWQDFANNSIFDNGVLEREISLYERDKNKSCVIIWSLGNESSYGKMFYEGADYIHEHDDRPIHYEGIFNLVDKTDYYTSRIDICSRMYPSINDIKKDYLDDPKETRPLLLCEYTHAMGNSCGDIKDYWDLINANDKIIGAFVWEWCDHAVIVDNKLKYGSDFNVKNDGNFCVDGLVSPYRKFKSSTYEVKAIYSSNYKEIKPVFKKLNLKGSNSNNYKLDIDSKAGSISVLDLNSNIVLGPIELSLDRADIDNDMFNKDEIKIIRNTKPIINMIDSNTINLKIINNNETIIDYKINASINNDLLNIKLDYDKKEEFYLQRVGIKFMVNKTNKISYFGYGPNESYVDKHHSHKIKEFKIKPRDLKLPYLKPQEYGSHYYTSYAKVNNLIIASDNHFSFSILPYSIEELINAKHDYDLKDSNKLYVNLDVFMTGVGSHACGPVLDKKYMVPSSSSNTWHIKIK